MHQRAQIGQAARGVCVECARAFHVSTGCKQRVSDVDLALQGGLSECADALTIARIDVGPVRDQELDGLNLSVQVRSARGSRIR